MFPAKLCIIGAGGFGREVLGLYRDMGSAARQSCEVIFAEEDACFQARSLHGIPVLPLSGIAPSTSKFVIAVAHAATRKRIAEAHPEFSYTTLVHPTALVGANVVLGAGSIVCAHAILTCDIRLGAHAHINLATTIGHDAEAGDFLTTAPGAHISGACRLGSSVFIGSGAVLRERVSVGDEVTIGAGAVVLDDIAWGGTYVGVPARRVH